MEEESRENGLRLEPVRRESEAEGTLIFPLEAGCHKRDEAGATTTGVDKEEAIENFLSSSFPIFSTCRLQCRVFYPVQSPPS